MTRQAWLVVAVLTLASAAYAQGSEEEAGDISEVDKDRMGPLRERIRPVSGHLFLKRGRFEFSPSITTSLTDAFWTKYIPGATLTFHVSETIAFGLRAGYALPVVSGAASECNPLPGGGLTCAIPTAEEMLGVAPGAITLLGGVDLQWAPLYGKISLLAERFAHFDMYGIVGASAVQYNGPGSPSRSLITVGGNIGLGMRFFLNRWIGLRAELRELLYVEEIRGGATSFRNQLLFELGFSMFLPTSFKPG